MPSLAFRGFGQAAADLEIDFAGLPRPHLVTRILTACAVPEPSAATCWGLGTGERTASLLRIVALGGTSELPVPLVCTTAECGERLEVELPIAALLRLHEATGEVDRVHLGADGGPTLRKPTGADQAEWWERGFDDEAAALRSVVSTLLVAPAPDGWLEEADLGRAGEELSRIDPLVDFHVAVSCPGCGREQLHLVDLQELVVAMLRRAQQSLLGEVHRLARAYHWSEPHIVALPPWRRHRYLALIEREEDG